MAIVIYLLIKWYSPAYAAFFAMVAILLIAMLQKDTPPLPGDILKGLVNGARMGASIGIRVSPGSEIFFL